MTQIEQTERDWAAAQGLCKANSRGRLPTAARDAIAAAKAEGVVFALPGYLTPPEKPSEAPRSPEDPEVDQEPTARELARSKAARATQERILRLWEEHEDKAFERMAMRKVTYADGAGHRVRVIVTARRDLFKIYDSPSAGLSFDMCTDKGFRSFPISSLIKIGSVDRYSKARHAEGLAVAKAKRKGKK
jgi:hypothetical protein